MFFLVALFFLGFFSRSWSGWRCLVGSFRACAIDIRAAPLVFEGGLGRSWRRPRIQFGLLKKMYDTNPMLTFLRPPESETTRLLGSQNFTRQSALGRTGHKISQGWTRRKLHLQHATVHRGGSMRKKLSKCHPELLMEGHVSCGAYKKKTDPECQLRGRKLLQSL